MVKNIFENFKIFFVVQKFSSMIYQHNVHAQSFKMARDIFSKDNVSELKLCLISERCADGRIYY